MKELRARAHHLKPVVTVGDAGASEGVLRELDAALTAHELLKVRLPALDKPGRSALAAGLCTASDAELIQLIGRVAVLYRPRPDAPRRGRARDGHS